jgi:outer membrane lipoprotein
MYMRHFINLRGFAVMLTAALLGACASNIPLEIREAPADNPTLDEVLADTAGYVSRRVRWGGVILETDNRANTTWVTLLALPLSANGRPSVSDNSPGRFMAAVPAFLDPTVYSKDRHLTVSGTVSGSETHKVGEFPYNYPVVDVEHYYLWPVEPKLPPPYRNPWWYDPWWYDPWWYDPWYPYPYRY